MKKIILIISLFLFLCSFKNNAKDSIQNKSPVQELSIKLDTLKVENIKVPEKQTVWYESNNMPWIVSLIIALSTIGINIYLARINQKTAIQNIKNQIDSSKSIALTQFRSTLNTKNRQEWINDVRHSTSDFLAQTALFSVIIFGDEPDTHKLLIPYFEKIYYYKNKIAMLLNTEKSEQNNLLKPINELVLIIANIKEGQDPEIIRSKEAEIINASRVLFDKHWQKIKIVE